MKPRTIISIAIILGLLGTFWIGSSIIGNTRRQSTSADVNVPVTPPSLAAVAQTSDQEKSLSKAAVITPTSPPLPEGKVVVWDNSGEIDPEFVQRYGLTNQQLVELTQLKESAFDRMVTIDRANSTTEISADGRSIKITITPNPTSAAAFTEFFEAGLQKILGSSAYADLAKYYSGPVMVDVLNAGIAEKQLEINRVESTAGVSPIYSAKSESKVLSTPPGVSPPHYNIHTTEVTGNRQKIEGAVPELAALIPTGF